MANDTVPVEHLFTVTITTTPPVIIMGGPQGTRVVVNATGGTFEGPRLKGTVAAGPGGDWVTMRADQSLKLDVRLLLHTDDGAAILMTYNGVAAMRDGAYEIRTAPLFETGDPRYAWLNTVQAVGIGKTGDGSVTYEIFGLV